MECVFCNIVQGKSPATVEWEDEKVIAIRDANPQAPIHLLIMPKEHFPSIDNVPNDILLAMLETAKALATQEGFSNGYRIVINKGPDGGQTVYHAHVHLLGGRPFGWPPG
ncbi:MAG TPA: HIT domain-containing protein [Coprothermobacter proteolyticus]|nr:HIT domain-containing protein [Coprothermobacter proteolyticus]HOK24017.1 HIT domain-containing protein [Coprothermobacter proteolyticus]HOL53177.1 HIT domain-containing protein [Coprothermobacter proteolyticus]HPO83269.1 HIT domain-containing protein [Coprothermobacter proteolyticus]HRC95973.1 HIT domain-containing protein [Coprothermobacter proteolyticus]